MPVRFLLAGLLLVTVPQQNTPQPDAIGDLVLRLEAAAKAGDRAAVIALARDPAAAGELPEAFGSVRPSRAVVKERDRVPVDGGAQRVLLEVFLESGTEGRLSTWNVDVTPEEGTWKIAGATRLANVTGLHRLTLTPDTQFEVRNLTVEATDLTLRMASGKAFVAETREGVTTVVLLGRGEMQFAPPDTAEQSQLRIFCGREALRTSFDTAFVRVRPSEFERLFPAAFLAPRAVVPNDLRRAMEVFNEYVGRTLQIDLADLSDDTWSITPNVGDLIAEIGTRRFGNLTYTRSASEAEDITLFDRLRRRNISVYASKAKLAQRGRFYSEDDLVDYDVLAYEIDASFSPDKFFIEGTARVKVKIRSNAVSTLSLRLAESLNVRGVYSELYGRVLHLRVIGQNTLLVNFPGFVVGGTELWLTVHYAGRISPQELDREAITVAQDAQEQVTIPPETRLLYSHRAYWYPQSSVSDYATAKITMTVPSEYQVVATGVPVAPAAGAQGHATQRGRRISVFQSDRPLRYLAFVVSRLRHVDTREVDGLQFNFLANTRQVGPARAAISRTQDVFRYFTSVVSRAPYPSFTVAFTERLAPGGHSPPYFAVLDQPVQIGVAPWRGDPVSFENYPDFFLAHEVAHQWWGQAVGWKNYHEQWLSEGFAQYFALLYAEKKLNERAYLTVLRQMNRTAIANADEGPIHLGYRLGHIKRDTAVFRSLLYNKSAMVLHMLRRLVGDEPFFAGLRAFYEDWEFRKAGTGDFQRAIERASGQNLTRFFETWIFGGEIPVVAFSYKTESNQVVLRFEQKGEVADIPISVTLTDGTGTKEIVVKLSERITEHPVPLSGRLRSVSTNADHGALVTMVR